MILQQTILSTIAELEQMKQGMKVQQFNSLMEKYPALLMSVFESHAVQLSCSLITEEMYSRSNAIFSADATKRIREEAFVNEWIKYVNELEGRHCA